MAKRVVRFSKLARFVHWNNLIMFVIFIVTGLALIAPSFNSLGGIFGGLVNARYLHRIAAVFFVVVPLGAIVYASGGFVNFMKETFSWGGNDTQWLMKFPVWLFKPSTDMPEFTSKGKPGQRPVGWFLLLGAAWQAVTGIILVFRFSLPKSVGLLATIGHDIGFIGLGVLLLGHMYLGLGLFKPYRGVWRGMLGDGTVDYEKAHHAWPHWTEKEAEVVEK